MSPTHPLLAEMVAYLLDLNGLQWVATLLVTGLRTPGCTVSASEPAKHSLGLQVTSVDWSPCQPWTSPQSKAELETIPCFHGRQMLSS